ncbi:MAG TPA: ABC transporter ATP-binding protein, partial [Fervidobacterium sp.]|nr:ABC transporter ATP-binding protein [Fervidobacterium sp.]
MNKNVFWRLLKYSFPYFHYMLVAIAIVISLTFFTLMPPQIVRTAINTYILSDSLSAADKITGISHQA